MSQLRKLDLKAVSAVHVGELRLLHQLHELRPPPWMSWAELLAPGHRLQLRQIECGGEVFTRITTTSQADCDALATLPSLTSVELRHCECTHVDFLATLPQLQRLVLRIDRQQVVDSARALTALRQCTQLQELLLSSSSSPQQSITFTPGWLRDCVSSLPLLRSLSLIGCDGVSSLDFLASGPITTTLTDLTLVQCMPRLPVAELQHIQKLRAVQRSPPGWWF